MSNCKHCNSPVLYGLKTQARKGDDWFCNACGRWNNGFNCNGFYKKARIERSLNRGGKCSGKRGS